MERQRTKELEEELRIIKLKLNTETQAKRDLQLQILRGNGAPSSNGNYLFVDVVLILTKKFIQAKPLVGCGKGSE